MIEAYAFLAVFTLQILALSIVLPAWFIRYVRAKAAAYPAECFAQLQPIVERRVTLYRALNAIVTLLGVSLMGWLYTYLQRPDWTDGPVEALISVYFGAQVLPLGLVTWFGTRFNGVLKRSLPEGKRKAMLERRGLLDFVSPLVLFLAVLSYFLFVAFVIYIEQDPFPGFAGVLVNIGVVTMLYAVTAFGVYTTLYGKKIDPLATHADRIRTIGLAVKFSVYSCIASVVFLSINFTLVILDLQRWEPFAQCILFVTSALFYSKGFNAMPPGVVRLESSTHAPCVQSEHRD